MASKTSVANKKPVANKKRDSAVVRAARRLLAGQLGEFEGLLATWRARRSTPLGQLLVRFGPPDDRVARAIAGLREQSTIELMRRVDKLITFEADPRIGAALTDLVIEPPFTSGSMKPLWTSMFAQLTGRQADARTLARLREADVHKQFGGSNMGTWVAGRLAQALTALEASVEAPKPNSDDETLAQLVADALPDRATASKPRASASAKPGSDASVVAACLANPEDDAPRLVYADLLEQRGDATQAEFIRLQLARAREEGEGEGEDREPSAREQELLRKHASKWLAPIVPVLKKDSWVFERGLMTACTVYPRKGKANELAGHPLWASVQHATLSETGDPAPILTDPIMSRLRSVRLWTYPRGLSGLLASDAPIEELHGIYLPNVTRDKALWAAFTSCERLPKLRMIEINGGFNELAVIAASKLARPGVRMFWATSGYRLGAWTQALRQLESKAQHTAMSPTLEVELVDGGVVATVGAKDPGAALWDAAFVVDAFNPPNSPLQPGDLNSFELRLPTAEIQAHYAQRQVDNPQAVLETLARRCEALRCPLTIRRGEFPTRYIDAHHVRL